VKVTVQVLFADINGCYNLTVKKLVSFQVLGNLDCSKVSGEIKYAGEPAVDPASD
jgi:hypothetical protein